MDLEFDQALQRARAERAALDVAIEAKRLEDEQRLTAGRVELVQLEEEAERLRESLVDAKEVIPDLERGWVSLSGPQRRMRRRHVALRIGLTLFCCAGISIGIFRWQAWTFSVFCIAGAVSLLALAGHADELERRDA